MSPEEPTEVTMLLRRWRGDDANAYDDLVGSVYSRLLLIAAGLSARERHSTSPAALVSEAYLRLRELQGIDWKDRNHFFSFAAMQMRRSLVDRARSRGADKREGNREHVRRWKAYW